MTRPVAKQRCGCGAKRDEPHTVGCIAIRGEAEPTAIERGYIEQGYTLPDGFDWQTVHERRKWWGIDELFVPLAVSPYVAPPGYPPATACVGWGVPHKDGKPLKHPPSRDLDGPARHRVIADA